MKKYSFLSVALQKDLLNLHYSIKTFKNFYKNINYIIVSPNSDINTFKKEFKKFAFVQIIDENEIFNKKKFFEICKSYLGNINSFEKLRIGWYYQQALKLTYLLSSKYFQDGLIIWDSDTIPLKKIKFFDKERRPILYGSRYEYHKPYFMCNDLILGEEFKRPKLSFITQFCYLDLNGRRELREIILKSNKKNKICLDETFIAHTIFYSIKKINFDNKVIENSCFSEYELVGTYLNRRYLKNKKQKPIKFMRIYVDGKVSYLQKIILYILGYFHITYEKKETLLRRQSYLNICKALLIDFRVISFLRFIKKYFLIS